MTTELEKAYLAAFLDGEGHIGITLANPRNHNEHREWRTHCVIVTIANTHLETLTWIQSLWMNGTLVIRKQKQQKVPIGNLRWSSNAASIVLKDILPYLHIKKGQATLAIRFSEELAARSRSSKYISEEEWLRREELRLAIRQLNRPDPMLKPEPYPYQRFVKKCVYCGKEFETQGTSRKYCSKHCKNAVRWQHEKEVQKQCRLKTT